MKKKKTRLISLLALVCALAALLLSAMNLVLAPEDQSHLIDDLYRENQALQNRVETLESQLDQLMTAANLQSWSVDVTPWSDSTGADVTLSAIPSSYRNGISATFLVSLAGQEVASIPCQWDGTAFTATASLGAADGYSYYCVLLSPGGTQQLPLLTPDSPDAGVPVYLQSSLSSYCNLVANDWIENPGSSLVLTDAYAQVQLPRISTTGSVEIASAEIVLRLNGKESVRIPITLSPSEVEYSFELVISDLEIPMPELEDSDSLELSLEIFLTDGRNLRAVGVTWQLVNGKLTSAVG